MRKLAALATTGFLLSAGSAFAAGHLDTEAHDAIMAFLDAVASGPEAVEKVLAPEYQIMRSNGVGYDHDGYLASVGDVDLSDFSADRIVATSDGDVMVTRYLLTTDETIGGTTTGTGAPRLTVFRKIDGEWKVSAHANFAPFEQPSDN